MEFPLGSVVFRPSGTHLGVTHDRAVVPAVLLVVDKRSITSKIGASTNVLNVESVTTVLDSTYP